MHPRNNAARIGASGKSLIAVTLVSATLLACCDEYLDRSDTITHGVGDAIAVNKATQTIERWPAAARHDRWLSDGERRRRAVDRYRNGEQKPITAIDTQSNTGAEAN